MPILRVVAEGVGPFEKLDLDLSDGNGKPHLGPHILAGVNGSGKSTALRTIGWVLDKAGDSGFPHGDWIHLLSSAYSRAVVVIQDHEQFELRVTALGDGPEAAYKLIEWVGSYWQHGLPGLSALSSYNNGQFLWSITRRDGQGFTFDGNAKSIDLVVAAYSPERSLRYLPSVDLTKLLQNPKDRALAFEHTVNNEIVQNWLASLISKGAIAEKQGRSAASYDRIHKAFESALSNIYRETVKLGVELEPGISPFLEMRNQRMNFSQLPDGVRTIVGWLADFMMRLQLHGGESGILLIDEIDAHLHPRWQRQILPALRAALPEVQIIVTSHSPFVINSCRGARVHVLRLNDSGRAEAETPVDAPFGQSVIATLGDVFEVDSQFDLETENDLNEWNRLRRKQAVGRLTPADRRKLAVLTEDLGSRGEELRWIVSVSDKLPVGHKLAR